MLVENRSIIKNINENLYTQINKLNENIPFETAKNESLTFSIQKGGKDVYFHSKYNPDKEAVDFINKQTIPDDVKHFFFIGTGLGYHIIDLLTRYPKVTYSIFEPNLAVLKLFLNHVNLKKYKGKLVQIITNVNEISDIGILTKIDSINIVWPKTELFYSKDVNSIFEFLSSTLKNKTQTLGTDSAFQKKWITNVLRNFGDILNSPNLLIDVDTNYFANKPVIIVAAGPSLNFEIELLKKIKEEGKAYIFSVGSAINSLLENGVKPHGVFSYDPKSRNSLVLEKFKQRNVADVPIIFGTSIGAEAILDHNGPKMHFILSQDTISPIMFNIDSEKIILDATSIAVVTLQIAAKLNFSEIILVGQNLAFFENKRYAEGISYGYIDKEMNDKERNEDIKVESVEGEMIFSSPMYLGMKNQLEIIINNFNITNVINTTKKGANIKGTKYMELEEVYNNILINSNIISPNWYVKNNSYNREQLLVNYNELSTAYKNVIIYTEKSMEIIAEMDRMYKSYLFDKIAPLYNKFDNYFSNVMNNIYFKQVLLPTIRVQYNTFTENTSYVANEKNNKKKFELFKEIFIVFVRNVYITLIDLDKYFQEFSSYINKYEEKNS